MSEPKFHQYKTSWERFDQRRQMLREGKGWLEYYNLISQLVGSEPGGKTLAWSEVTWYLGGRPFYRLWPMVVSCLQNTQLNVPWTQINLPVPTLLIQLPVGQEIRLPIGDIGSFLVSKGQPAIDDDGSRINLWTLTGLTVAGTQGFDFRTVIDQDRTIQDQLDEQNTANPEIYRGCMECAPFVRLAVGVALLSQNPDLVEPILLRRHQKQAKTLPPEKVARFAQAARDKGQYGFNVGARLQPTASTCPHYRRPHFAIRWKGRGRVQPSLVPVRGCVVNRSRLSRVPTGHLDREAQSAEAQREP